MRRQHTLVKAMFAHLSAFISAGSLAAVREQI